MKKKLMIGITFLTLLLVMQSIPVNAVMAKTVVFHPSIDKYFVETWTIEKVKRNDTSDTSWTFPGTGGVMYRADNSTSVNETITTINTGGTGYKVNDTFYLAGGLDLNFKGKNATFKVFSNTTNGEVTAINMTDGGDYAGTNALTTPTDVATTNTSGIGSGLTLDVGFLNYTYTAKDATYNYDDIVLKQGEKITLNWTIDPASTYDLSLSGPIDYTGLEVYIGNQKLNQSAYETFFNFLVLPVYLHKATIKYTEPLYWSMNQLEAYWFMTFTLPNMYPPGAMQQYATTLDMENASLENTGELGVFNTSIFAHILTPDPVWTVPEFGFLDLWIDAVTGIVTQAKYPSVGTKGGNICNATNHPMSIFLDELLITFDGDMQDYYDLGSWGLDESPAPPITPTKTVTTTSTVKTTTTITHEITKTEADGFAAITAIIGISAMVIVVRRRRRR